MNQYEQHHTRHQAVGGFVAPITYPPPSRESFLQRVLARVRRALLRLKP